MSRVCGSSLDEPRWWNGRHEGLKSLYPQGCESSTLSRGTSLRSVQARLRSVQAETMSYSVYILKCFDNSIYVGITGNLAKRIKEHADGLVPYTKNRNPLKLIYKEEYSSRIKAAKREKEIKGWTREKKIRLSESLR